MAPIPTDDSEIDSEIDEEEDDDDQEYYSDTNDSDDDEFYTCDCIENIPPNHQDLKPRR